jgi:O6-methylguanine-DNA--protein-cysteine methyltransferase
MLQSDLVSYTIFETRAGWMGVSGSSLGLLHSTLPQNSKELAMTSLGEITRKAAYSSESYADTIKILKDYFTGSKVAFTDKLDLSPLTGFQRAVLEVTRVIPYGQTRSYG